METLVYAKLALHLLWQRIMNPSSVNSLRDEEEAKDKDENEFKMQHYLDFSAGNYFSLNNRR